MEIITPKMMLAGALYCFGIPTVAALWHAPFGGTSFYWMLVSLFVIALAFCVPMLKRDADEIEDDLKRWDERLAREREGERMSRSTW